MTKGKFSGDTGEQRGYITNQIEEMAPDGRIRRRTERINLNADVGHGCKLEPDPPDPFDHPFGKGTKKK